MRQGGDGLLNLKQRLELRLNHRGKSFGAVRPSGLSLVLKECITPVSKIQEDFPVRIITISTAWCYRLVRDLQDQRGTFTSSTS